MVIDNLSFLPFTLWTGKGLWCTTLVDNPSSFLDDYGYSTPARLGLFSAWVHGVVSVFSEIFGMVAGAALAQVIPGPGCQTHAIRVTEHDQFPNNLKGVHKCVCLTTKFATAGIANRITGKTDGRMTSNGPGRPIHGFWAQPPIPRAMLVA